MSQHDNEASYQQHNPVLNPGELNEPRTGEMGHLPEVTQTEGWSEHNTKVDGGHVFSMRGVHIHVPWAKKIIVEPRRLLALERCACSRDSRRTAIGRLIIPQP